MQEDDASKFSDKIICFSDRAGHSFSRICRMPLISGVLDVYQCNAIKNLGLCLVTYGPGMVFVQPKCPDDSSDPNGGDYRAESIKTQFCPTCTIKHNCGR